MSKRDPIRFVIVQDDGLRVAQGLEHDICVQGANIEDISRRIDATLDAERDFARSEGMKPFENIDPAPKPISNKRFR